MAKKKRFLSLAALVLASAFLLCGCETAKGVAVGTAVVGMGVAKDTQNFWQGAKKADDWLRKNLW